MSRVCIITGKKPLKGNFVSNSNRHVKRRFLPNLQSFSFYSEKQKKKLRLVISVNGARTVRKRGIDNIKFNCGV